MAKESAKFHSAFDQVHKGFTLTVLEDAFGRVSPVDDWKAPIDAEVEEPELAEALAAVEFYTSTTPMVELLGRGKGGPRYRIRSVGYRAGPAGDQ